jgi:hypothetical protein
MPTSLKTRAMQALLTGVICIPHAHAQAPKSNEADLVWSPQVGLPYGLQQLPGPDPSNEVGPSELLPFPRKNRPFFPQGVLVCEPGW